MEFNYSNKSSVIPLIDYTRLNETDTVDNINAFCNQALAATEFVAALCVYPKYIAHLKSRLIGTPIKIATVVNFPEGCTSFLEVETQISKALCDGVDEIDIVFPYQRFLNGDTTYAYQFIKDCRAMCGDHVLKVILETGAIIDAELIKEASHLIIDAKADFIKTSTGKIAIGATVDAATAILHTIEKFGATKQDKPIVGLKVSGGIREWHDAFQYTQLVETMMGSAWISPQTFRIGTSRLLNE
jgi:deoxyribose-phosphate aldolase